LTLSRQCQFVIRRLLRFLDEAMQCHKHSFIKAQKHARDALAGQFGPYFPKPLAKRTAQGHANGPAPLSAHKVLANGKTIRGIQRFNPVSYWFIAVAASIENQRRLLDCVFDQSSPMCKKYLIRYVFASKIFHYTTSIRLMRMTSPMVALQ